MPINHNLAHYLIGGAAVALAGYGLAAKPVDHTPPAAIHAEARPGRLDWPSLGEGKTIALGEALRGIQPGKVTLFCSSPACTEIRKDIDDAMQIAQWDSDFEDRLVDSEAERGIFVGPPGDQAQNLIVELGKIGIEAKEVGITDDAGNPIQGLGIIIGKFGANHEKN